MGSLRVNLDPSTYSGTYCNSYYSRWLSRSKSKNAFECWVDIMRFSSVAWFDKNGSPSLPLAVGDLSAYSCSKLWPTLDGGNLEVFLLSTWLTVILRF